MKLSELLRRYREENLISQRELARRCGLSNSLISLMEMGRNPQTGREMSPDLETYQKLARGMQTTVHDLFNRLGNDATVKLSGTQEHGLHVGAAWYGNQMRHEDSQKLRMAFDSAPKQPALNPEDEELIDLWTNASETAKQAALAVLRAMEGK